MILMETANKYDLMILGEEFQQNHKRIRQSRQYGWNKNIKKAVGFCKLKILSSCDSLATAYDKMLRESGTQKAHFNKKSLKRQSRQTDQIN